MGNCHRKKAGPVPINLEWDSPLTNEPPDYKASITRAVYDIMTIEDKLALLGWGGNPNRKMVKFPRGERRMTRLSPGIEFQVWYGLSRLPENFLRRYLLLLREGYTVRWV